MRIAFVVHEYGRTFGHSRYVWELARRFRAAHDVHVFANRFEPGDATGLTLHHVPALRMNALSTIVSFIPAATWRTRRGFDIVHAQGLTTLHPDVVTAHICLAAWFDARRDESIGENWRQRLFERVTVPMEHAFYARVKHSSRVIAISQGTRRDLAQHYHVHDRVDVIPHGVDLVGFSPERRLALRPEVRAELGLAPDETWLLFVGDLRRGAAAAIDAVARVPGARLLLVSRSDAAPFETHAQAAGVVGRVRFLPATDRIERMYAAADAFIFPTPYDAFGMVIAEAMAMGLPVITTRRAGASELIHEGTSGLLVDAPGDLAGLAAHVARLVDQPAFAERMGAAARERVATHSWDDVARETLAVYARVLDERRGTG